MGTWERKRLKTHKKHIERSILIKKKLFMIVQPDHFNKEYLENTQKAERIIVMDLRGKVFMDDTFNADSYLYVRRLLSENVELITYNGCLLRHMIWKFWNYDSNRVRDLMEEFSVIYGEELDWTYEDGEPLYIWQKLSTALDYYGVEDSAVDIYNPMEVIKKTLTLYRKMEKE
jgi:hypothetical protein